MFKKKGQANMFWIIIGAVIALVVMLVLILMFSSKVNILEGGLLDCESKNGQCISEEQCEVYKGTWSKAFECSDSSEGCCFTDKGEE